jgi:hypothetical protein
MLSVHCSMSQLWYNKQKEKIEIYCESNSMNEGVIMPLFCLRATVEQMKEYLRESYISIHLPWLTEDVEFVTWEQLCASNEQASDCEQLRLFVYNMQDEDLIIVTDGESAYLGDLGDYYYVEEMLDEQALQLELPPRLHRRGVTWLKSITAHLSTMAPALQQFLANTEILEKYGESVSLEGLEAMLIMHNSDAYSDSSNNSIAEAAFVDDSTIREAIDVLKKALRSEDVDRRERAAIALLNFTRK